MKKLLATVALAVATATAVALATMPGRASAGNYRYIWNPCPYGQTLYMNVFGQSWCG